MKNTYHIVSNWLGKDLLVLIFKRGKKQCLHPVSTISVSVRMLRACPLSWVKAKRAVRKMQLRFTKVRLHLINLNSYCDERSGHTAQGIDATYLECPEAPGTSPCSTHISKLRPDGWLERLRTCLGRQNWRPDCFKLLHLLASDSKSTLQLLLVLIQVNKFINNLDDETESVPVHGMVVGTGWSLRSSLDHSMISKLVDDTMSE